MCLLPRDPVSRRGSRFPACLAAIRPTPLTRVSFENETFKNRHFLVVSRSWINGDNLEATSQQLAERTWS